jgi:hypothetical protein
VAELLEGNSFGDGFLVIEVESCKFSFRGAAGEDFFEDFPEDVDGSVKWWGRGVREFVRVRGCRT